MAIATEAGMAAAITNNQTASGRIFCNAWKSGYQHDDGGGVVDMAIIAVLVFVVLVCHADWVDVVVFAIRIEKPPRIKVAVRAS